MYYRVIDTNKYDIVEKKEYKVERLKSEIENYESTIDTAKKLIEYYTGVITRVEKEILNTRKELKTLE